MSIDQTRLAPHGSLQHKPWRGILEKHPSEYLVTAAISHNNVPESLFAVLDLLRGQQPESCRPYIMVMDTGSPGHVIDQLLQHESAHQDFEVHFVRSRGYSSPVQPVTAAMDLAFSLCQTEYLYSTHADVFLRRPDVLEFLISACSAQNPAVGYQMSPREGSGNQDWRTVVGHAATLYHMPTMRELGITWNILAACQLTGFDHSLEPGSWPDTEVMVSLQLQNLGFAPGWITRPEPGQYLLLTPEPNHAYSTALLRHERVGASSMIYYRGTDEGEARRLALVAEAEQVPARLKEWREYPPGVTLKQVLPVIRDCPFAGDTVSAEGARSCSSLCRQVNLDDCIYCKLGPPSGQVIQSIGTDWLFGTGGQTTAG